MLKEITLRRYVLASSLIYLIALLFQLHLKQGCAWDGCFPTAHPTLSGALFGLPAAAVEIELFIGVVIWVTKVSHHAKHK